MVVVELYESAIGCAFFNVPSSCVLLPCKAQRIRNVQGWKVDPRLLALLEIVQCLGIGGTLMSYLIQPHCDSTHWFVCHSSDV
jgi:hypothetical protein